MQLILEWPDVLKYARWDDKKYYRYCEKMDKVVLITDRQTGIYIECEVCKNCKLKK